MKTIVYVLKENDGVNSAYSIPEINVYSNKEKALKEMQRRFNAIKTIIQQKVIRDYELAIDEDDFKFIVSRNGDKELYFISVSEKTVID